MPVILKKCFLYHYDPKINSDKVFNLFLVDHEDGSYSAISEHGRSETKLRVLPLVERCSLSTAEQRFSAKRQEKIFHEKTPYLETFNCDYSPTLKQMGAFKAVPIPTQTPAKILEFNKPAKSESVSAPVEKESGEQTTEKAAVERRSKRIGILNLDRLDALEF
ncbi:MAG: hypothetical protein M3367_11890 [Acidobacteriota bacterium]|nr:hypothetical protein [Acidobacteriota bacterium]